MANRRFIDFPIASSVGDSDIVLIWQDGMNKQTTKGTLIQGAPTSLEGLTDVDIAGLINGQILQYNSTTGKWENVDRTDINLSELGDVSIVSPTNGQVLVYNSSTSKWENSSGGYVPYTGAVTTVDLGAQGLRAGYIRFDTSVTSVPDEQGLMYWDASRSTAALIMNGVLQHIGQDTFFYVKNSTGSSIAKGTSVRFDGTDGASGHLKIAPFLANGTYPSNYFVGVTAETIANGAFGQVMHFGELGGINTSAYTAGALLYASTTVAGGFQTTAPVAPNNIVLIAAAINSKNNGTILVRPTYGSNINTDEGVKITSGTTGDLLQLQAGGLWENKTLAQVIGSAYVPSTRTITINGTTQDLSANRTFNVGTVTSVGLSSATSGVTIGSTPVTGSGTITIAIATASGSQNGLLSSTDWTTFNSKQNALTNPVTGTGTTNTIPKFTGTSTIGNSIISENGSVISIAGNLNIGSLGNLAINAGSAATPLLTQSTNYTEIYRRSGGVGIYLGGTGDAANYYDNTSHFFRSSGGGSVYATINSTGNLGLGVTPSASNKLEVLGTAASPTLIGTNSYARFFQSGGYANVTIGALASGSFAGWIQSSDGVGTSLPLAIQPSGGNLLVGTTTDAGFKLDVNGTGRFSSSVTATSSVTITRSGTSNSNGLVWSTTGSADWYLGSSPLGNATSDLSLYSYGTNSVVLNIVKSTGAATFSNDIFARSGTIDSRVFKIYEASANRGGLYPYNLVAGSGTDYSIGIFSENEIFLSSGGSATKRVVLTSGGNVGIGTTAPTNLTGYTTLSINNSTFGSIFEVMYNGTPYGRYFASTNTAVVLTSLTSIPLIFATNDTERMRITSGGNVLIGTTTDAGSKLRVNQGGVAWAQIIDHSNAAAQFYIDFRYNGTGTGSIIGYSTFTAYNTMSDYRLKEDLRKVNGLEKINAINVYNYKWKESETRMDGVLAHELAEVLPYAVSGQKDGIQMQGVDYSKIVPLLIQSIKELKQEIDTLKN
jgi:hypothetical protein